MVSSTSAGSGSCRPSAAEGDGPAPFESKADILDHLSCGELHDDDGMDARGGLLKSRRGNGQSVIGRNMPARMPVARARSHRRPCDSCGRAIGDNHDVRSLEIIGRETDLVRLDLGEFLLQVLVVRLELIWLEVQ